MVIQKIGGAHRVCIYCGLNNSKLNLKTTHVQLNSHFIISILKGELLKLEKIHARENIVDMLTKVVTREKLSSYLVSVGLKS